MRNPNFPERINRGDIVRIVPADDADTVYQDRFGSRVILQGEVISAINYGTDEKPQWYIEIQDKVWKYVYVKQDQPRERLASILVIKAKE